ncbi:MAG: transcriptional repressor, partial [Gluconacetobacter diazotrophicus]|nr:transcriptional repressor [Gluconacetobacter diazotrophicus]
HDHDHHGHDDHRHGDVQFLICRRCGRTVELESAAISEALRRAATTAGFSPQRATVEIEGFCVDCGAAGMLDGERLPTNA